MQANDNSWGEGHFRPVRLSDSPPNQSSHKAQDTCKMGADHGRLKGRTGLLSLLEHNGDDVVPDVALPFHLD